MNKILLIIQREYLTRVRKKSFIIMSLIGPILMASLIVVPIWLTTLESKKKMVQVVDESGFFSEHFQNSSSIEFHLIDEKIDQVKTRVTGGDLYGVLHIFPFDLGESPQVTFYCEKNPSIEVISSIEDIISTRIEDLRLEKSEISKEFLESLQVDVDINTINISKEGEKAGSAEIATAVGYISSLMIYFFILFYGVQVLRGVIEEKTNRIVEIIISSVRPFQLMAGKIIGIGGVGLTQFLIWLILGFGISSVAGLYFQPSGVNTGIDTAGQQPEIAQNSDFMDMVITGIGTMNFPLIIFSFLFYFMGAYLLYGSLFAAIGSAVDNETDGQQFQLPVTIPLIASIIVLAAVLKDPDGSLAFWMSVIPFTSPVVMMMRIPFGVPAWELILSMVMLVSGFIFTIWLASRIYRIGILMYGAKVNYKILGKWLFMKN